MTDRARELYRQLQSADAVKALVGRCEDSHFDCKEWPNKEEDAQKTLAKAACGLANADGGILVIGMKARSKGKDEPDVVIATAPVANTTVVASKVHNLIGDLVEPGIEGLEATEINDPAGDKSGFVVVYVPASEGGPRRSRKDWKFYRRYGAGTFPMEYFEIEEMFGRRPRPRLELILEKVKIGHDPFDARLQRVFRVALANVGRGLAKFPSIRFKTSCGLTPDRMFGLDGNGNTGLPPRASDGGWVIFRGGIDDVIYPLDTLAITHLRQPGKSLGKVGPEQRQGLWVSNNPNETKWIFDPIEFTCEVSCEGIATVTLTKTFDDQEYRA